MADSPFPYHIRVDVFSAPYSLSPSFDYTDCSGRPLELHALHGCPRVQVVASHEPEAHIADVPSGPWLKVAVCEEGGRNDPTYGYLGILPSTWANYGMSGTAGDAPWSAQVAVAERIQGSLGVPDQAGCGNGW